LEALAQSLWQKYETELTYLWTFAKKNLEIVNFTVLPSGSMQLRHMKKAIGGLLTA
jgi:hypothetical protein